MSERERECETLVRQHMPMLLRVARRMMRSEEDARDAVQHAFVHVAARIVVNACLMRLRTQRRHSEEAIDDYLPQFAENGHQVPANENWPETAETLLERRRSARAARPR